jgi:parallel beta-helix repeat protein
MITKTALALAAPLLLNFAATSPVAYADGTISSCPTTITSGGTWTLTKDLAAGPNITCIIVAADNVAINLNDHVITGGFNSTAIGDRGSHKKIFIGNGTFRTFLQAINMNSGSSDVTISHVSVTDCRASGIHVKGDHAVVTDVVASNSFIGMALDGSDNEVYHTTANNNVTYGIEFTRRSSSNNTISDSVANSNGVDGMRFEGDTNTVVNSHAVANGDNGMFFAHGDNTITDSNANDNAGDGIFIGRSGNTLTGNIANNNGKAGISVVCPSTLSGNTANGNPDGGIVTSGSPACNRFGNTPAP